MYGSIQWTQPLKWHLQFSSDERTLIERIGLIAFFAGFTSLCAQIAFITPWTPVPYTFQTFAVMATGVFLRRNDAFLSGLLYLLLGAIGAPVFAEGKSGLFNDGALIASGGYLLAFPIASAVVAHSLDKSRTNGIPLVKMQWLAWFFAMIPVYFFGTLWLSYSVGVGLGRAFALGVLPFIGWDIFKIAILGLITTKLWAYQK